MNRKERNVIRLGLILGALAGVMTGCAHGPAPVVQVESVGTLAAGPSVYSQPVHATTDFAAPQLVDTGSDDVAAGVSTTVRTADAGSDAEAPAVVGKGGGLMVGGVR